MRIIAPTRRCIAITGCEKKLYVSRCESSSVGSTVSNARRPVMRRGEVS